VTRKLPAATGGRRVRLCLDHTGPPTSSRFILYITSLPPWHGTNMPSGRLYTFYARMSRHTYCCQVAGGLVKLAWPQNGASDDSDMTFSWRNRLYGFLQKFHQEHPRLTSNRCNTISRTNADKCFFTSFGFISKRESTYEYCDDIHRNIMQLSSHTQDKLS
jgi:hypothetical protein